MGSTFPYFLGGYSTSMAAVGAASEAGAQARTVSQRVDELEDRIDRLLLVATALWSLVRETSGLSEEQLLERVKEIDLSDGSLDGKSKVAPVPCESCGRLYAPRHMRCIWCGAERKRGSAFDAAR